MDKVCFPSRAALCAHYGRVEENGKEEIRKGERRVSRSGGKV